MTSIDTAKLDATGKIRSIRDVQPGWVVRNYEGSTERWMRVRTCLQFEKIDTGQKYTQLIGLDLEDPGISVDSVDPAGAEVFALNKKEAKRAGITD